MKQAEPERMQCMEVWGGNQAIRQEFHAPGLRIWVHSLPFDQAAGGGDVCYLSSCASGRITRLLLADVSGHGELVSQTAIGLRDLMRRNVNYIKQTRFVRAMNRQFAELNDQGGFATALVSTFFSPTMTFSLCNAGHPVPLVYRHETSQWSPLRNLDSNATHISDTPLGVVDRAAYSEIDLKLQTGDMVLSFSDAVTESQGTSGRQLGEPGTLRLVNELRIEEPEDVIPGLVERITTLNEGNLSHDDATLLLVQATGGGPPLKNSLNAPFRFLGGVTDHTRLV